MSVLSPKTYYDLRRLSPKTRYDVQVRAVSEAGKGEWSGVVQATTYGGTYNTNVLFHFKLLQTPSLIFQVPGPVRSLSATSIAVNGVPALHVSWSPPVDKAGGGLTYRLRVVPPHVTISRPVTATEYNVTGLRANTRYTVYVSAGSTALYGPEVSTFATTVGSECRTNDYDTALYYPDLGYVFGYV